MPLRNGQKIAATATAAGEEGRPEEKSATTTAAAWESLVQHARLEVCRQLASRSCPKFMSLPDAVQDAVPAILTVHDWLDVLNDRNALRLCGMPGCAVDTLPTMDCEGFTLQQKVQHRPFSQRFRDDNDNDEDGCYVGSNKERDTSETEESSVASAALFCSQGCLRTASVVASACAASRFSSPECRATLDALVTLFPSLKDNLMKLSLKEKPAQVIDRDASEERGASTRRRPAAVETGSSSPPQWTLGSTTVVLPLPLFCVPTRDHDGSFAKRKDTRRAEVISSSPWVIALTALRELFSPEARRAMRRHLQQHPASGVVVVPSSSTWPYRHMQQCPSSSIQNEQRLGEVDSTPASSAQQRVAVAADSHQNDEWVRLVLSQEDVLSRCTGFDRPTLAAEVNRRFFPRVVLRCVSEKEEDDEERGNGCVSGLMPSTLRRLAASADAQLLLYLVFVYLASLHMDAVQQEWMAVCDTDGMEPLVVTALGGSTEMFVELVDAVLLD